MTTLMTSVAAGNSVTNAMMLARITNASGSVELNCIHNIFDITQADDIEFDFSNVPTAAVITIMITRTGGHSETWPASVTPGDGVMPAPSVGPGLMDIYTLITVTAGARWIFQPFALGVSL